MKSLLCTFNIVAVGQKTCISNNFLWEWWKNMFFFLHKCVWADFFKICSSNIWTNKLKFIIFHKKLLILVQNQAVLIYIEEQIQLFCSFLLDNDGVTRLIGSVWYFHWLVIYRTNKCEGWPVVLIYAKTWSILKKIGDTRMLPHSD